MRWPLSAGPTTTAPEDRPGNDRLGSGGLAADIGRTVQQARRRLGLTQKDLAETADVSVAWLSKLENGRGAAPRMDYLGKMADAVGLDVHDLVAGDLGRLRQRQSERGPAGPGPRPAAAPRAGVEQPSTRWGTILGWVWFPWVVAGYGPYRPEHIASYFAPVEPTYPPEVERALAELHEETRRQAVAGEEVEGDADGYKLVRFHVSSRVGELEEPRLILHFRPTTRYRALVTGERLDVPLTAGGRTYTLRERYAAAAELREAPVPELATLWRVGLGVVTADGWPLVSECREPAAGGCEYLPAVAAVPVRVLAAAPDGTPDHFATCRRAVLEELGVELRPDELRWLSFGADSCLCQYALVGRVDLVPTLTEIEDPSSVVAAGGGRQPGRLHGVEFGPEAVARFCSDPLHTFSPLALIAIVHTLMHEFGVSRTEAAFADASVQVSQELPSWLGWERTEERLSRGWCT
jgi:transcriptional regulator with XRE-family HTH domain